MRKISLLLASLALIAVSGPLFAGKIQYSGTAPTISTGNAAIDSVLNAQLQATFDQLLVQATDQLDNINDMPDFMKSMSTAKRFHLTRRDAEKLPELTTSSPSQSVQWEALLFPVCQQIN